MHMRTIIIITIIMIDDRPCVLGSVSAIYLFISPLEFAIRKTRARRKFQRALRSKKEEAISRRGPANCHRRGQLLMVTYVLMVEIHSEHSKSFLLLLCHYARF
ncbi:unnamed protein product [Heterotrigona itama]|uniref:Uncharacterized protein n=1 Tax=Heterotrigona itama TaxID=395501 RepID=A0A6V7H9S2_9HYME|nr:unnamed protein product [Heterotrigona itama]